jgi:O-antigen/teichoic acid export membrane protein
MAQTEQSTEKSFSLRELVIKASFWTVAGMGFSYTLRLATNVILAKLLFPEAFGLMALVFIFVHGIELLSDIGIGPSIIQNERGDEKNFINTAWTLQICRGLLVWLFLLLIAAPVAGFYEEPLLLWLIPIVGLSAVMAGFEATAQFTLNRQLKLGKLTILQIGSQMAAIPVMLLWAYFSPSVYALVAGAMTTAVVSLIWSHFLIPGQRNSLCWERDSVYAVIHFGKWIFASTAIGFLAEQSDRMIMGKLVPIEMLGIYSIAFMLQRVPLELIGQLGYKVMFPVISKQLHLPRSELRAKISHHRQMILVVLALGVALLVVGGDMIIRALYDERYHAAGWMLQILAVGLWPRVLVNTLAPALLSLGKPSYLAYANAIRLVFVIIALPLSHMLYGMPGVVIVVSATGMIDYIVKNYGLWRDDLLLLKQDIIFTAVFAALIALFSLLGVWLDLSLYPQL